MKGPRSLLAVGVTLVLGTGVAGCSAGATPAVEAADVVASTGDSASTAAPMQPQVDDTSVPTAAPALPDVDYGVDASGSAAPVASNTVTVRFGGRSIEMSLLMCSAVPSVGIRGGGADDTYDLLLDAEDAGDAGGGVSGSLTLTQVSDGSPYLVGQPTSMKVSSDGTFTVKGSARVEGKEHSFTAKGVCPTS